MSDEVTENLAAPKAADLPVGSIVATDTLALLHVGPVRTSGAALTGCDDSMCSGRVSP